MRINGVFAGVIAGVAGFILVTRGINGTAPVPPNFVSKVALTPAVQAGKQSGKPVVAMATADWCGPCQSLKRGALTDPRIVLWIGEHAETAYIDGTDGNDPALAQLKVEGFPTLVFIRSDGTEVSRLVGNVDAEEMLKWLESSAAKKAG